MAIVIAGERSGVGKTTVTLALLAFLSRKGEAVQSFKVGPDYIDPMFHRAVTGRPCHNLDAWLTSEAYIQDCFTRHTQAVDYALVEGVMGLFDGAANQKAAVSGLEQGTCPDFASTAHIARSLHLPIVLVIDCSRLSGSVAAIVHGYRTFDSRLNLAGVVLNRVGSDRHLELLRAALEPIQVPILGVLQRQDAITIPDRHLGLVPAGELNHLHALIDQLAHLGETCFDWAQLLPLMQKQEAGGRRQEAGGRRQEAQTVRVAIAYDAAFSFYYADNLDLLQDLGAELVFWSPLSAATLPEQIQGLYFGGGFPEMFAQQLADNRTARAAVHRAIQVGMPTYAECGGLMYLCQNLLDFSGQPFPMVGMLPTDAMMGQRLTLGYRQAIAQHNTPLVCQGQTIYGHEFHRSHLTISPEQPLFKFEHQSEGWSLYQLHASYIHQHWGACPQLPRRFLHHCRTFPPASVPGGLL